jgi:hypothetical protein
VLLDEAIAARDGLGEGAASRRSARPTSSRLDVYVQWLDVVAEAKI